MKIFRAGPRHIDDVCWTSRILNHFLVRRGRAEKEKAMSGARTLPVISTVCAFLVVACSAGDVGTPRSPVPTGPSSTADDVGASANQQLAAARQATAKYHDFQQALADGYVQSPVGCIEGEGIHYRRPNEFPNASLNCVFDPANPEVLHYAPKQNGELQLVGVEYLVPKRASCGTLTSPPEGFSGDADEWESEGGGTLWALNAWIWQGVPDGVFAFRSEKITCN